MKKRIVSVIVTMVMLFSLALTGCSSNSESSSNDDSAKSKDGKTITWLAYGPGDESWEGKTKDILAAFEKETGIKVNAEFYAFGDLFDVLETKLAAGSRDIDVMSVDVTYVAKYAESDYLSELDQYFSNEEKAEFDKASYTAGVWEDKLYGVAENTSTQLLYYNQTLLDEAGITVPENSPENRLTYEEVAKLAKQALEKLDPDGSRGLIGFDFQQVSRVYQMNMLANAKGGANIGDDGFAVDGIINTPAWEEAMTWYQNLVNNGIASKGYSADETGTLFESGSMIFMIGGTWTPSGMVVGDKVGYAYAPCFEGYEDNVATSTGSWYFGVNANSENQDAAAQFVKYMSLGTGNDMWLEANGDIPSRIAKLKEMTESADSSDMMKMAAYEAANTAVPRAVTPAFGEYSTVLDQTWEDVRNGADVKKALESAVSQIDSAMAGYK